VPRLKLTSALALGALTLAPLGCSPDAAPTAPSLRQGPLLSKADDAAFDADGDGRLNDEEKAAKEAAEDAAKAAEEAADDAAKADKAAKKRAFEEMRGQWRVYQDSVKKGLVEAEFVRCEPQARQDETRKIGPKGGELKVGPHKLVIPAGALASEVEITGVAPTNSRRELEFYPHGLEFAKPVTMTISYDKCIVPAGADLQIVYTALGNKIIARQPSMDDRDMKEVSGLTDHFSGYVVATGRRGRE
jgi:hypothetical protein